MYRHCANECAYMANGQTNQIVYQKRNRLSAMSSWTDPYTIDWWFWKPSGIARSPDRLRTRLSRRHRGGLPKQRADYIRWCSLPHRFITNSKPEQREYKSILLDACKPDDNNRENYFLAYKFIGLLAASSDKISRCKFLQRTWTIQTGLTSFSTNYENLHPQRGSMASLSTSHEPVLRTSAH